MERTQPGMTDSDDQKKLEIRRILAKNSVFASDRQLDLLGHYVVLLREWNERVNLISRKDVDNVWESHILHSLGLVLEVRIDEGLSVLDLGSGGGLPGIPISILRPDLQVTLLDATQKKVTAVEGMLNKLGVPNVDTMWGRIEEKATLKKLAGRFDAVVARAVAPLPDLAAWCRPCISSASVAAPPSPHLVALKGGDLDRETEKARQLAYVKDVHAKDLTFYGAENIPGVAKQIVTVYFLP